MPVLPGATGLPPAPPLDALALPLGKVRGAAPLHAGSTGTEACCFFAALRLTRSQISAVVAMLLPFYLVTADYGVESRVYARTGRLHALALLCWTYLATGGRRRRITLIGLTVALAAACLFHYYGVFLLLPVYVGELTRTLERRRVDRPVVAALVLAAAAALLDLPFQKALAPFREHYYSTGETAWSNIPFTYLWFYRHFRIYTDPAAYVARNGIVALCVLGLLLGASFWRLRRRWRKPGIPASVEITLSMVALLPVCNLVAAQFTRAYVPRYSLPAVIGITLLTVLLVRDCFVLPPLHVLLACYLGYGSVSYVVERIGDARLGKGRRNGPPDSDRKPKSGPLTPPGSAHLFSGCRPLPILHLLRSGRGKSSLQWGFLPQLRT